MWTAVSLWTMTLGGAALYANWARGLAAQGTSVALLAAGALAVYLAVFLAFMTAYFTLAWLGRAPRPPQARIGVARTLRLIANEYRALVVSAWRMMFFALLMRDPPPSPAARPVLLVHGVLCNAGAWGGFARRLSARGVGPVYSLSYGPTLASIDLFADQLAAKIDLILTETGANQVVIVAHSMGGLVALAYCRKYGAANVRRIISLGAPYHGSLHAWLFPGRCLAQMHPGNPWLAELHRARFSRPPIHSIWSWHDSMVTPQTSSRLEGADNIALVGVGRNALLADPDAAARAIALIDAARAPGEASTVTSESPA
jgi:pimeloyl-ACP methyl ester carboxylesterase